MHLHLHIISTVTSTSEMPPRYLVILCVWFLGLFHISLCTFFVDPFSCMAFIVFIALLIVVTGGCFLDLWIFESSTVRLTIMNFNLAFLLSFILFLLFCLCQWGVFIGIFYACFSFPSITGYQLFTPYYSLSC